TMHERRHQGDGKSFPECPFDPAHVLAKCWQLRSGSPKTWFEQWSLRYVQAFGAAHPRWVAEALQRHLETRFAQPMSVTGFATARGLGYRQLQKEFRLLTGISVKEYLTQCRVRRATELIERTGDKIEYIASHVGWASRKDLNRAIKQVHGQSPRDLRRRAH